MNRSRSNANDVWVLEQSSTAVNKALALAEFRAQKAGAKRRLAKAVAALSFVGTAIVVVLYFIIGK